ncbi:MAG TPA: DUF6325 family protein [Actinomycetes bacterium]
MEEFGPVQILVIGFQDGRFSGAILEELRRLREHDIVRLVDLLFVTKGADGEITALETSDLTKGEFQDLGALAGALIGVGAAGATGLETGAAAGAEAMAAGTVFDQEEVWEVADAIPAGSSAALALLEHRWAIPLRDAIADAGGVSVADEWVHPRDLVAAGAALDAQAQQPRAEQG